MKWTPIRIGMTFLLVILALWISFASYVVIGGRGHVAFPATAPSSGWGELGTFGDSFGAITSLFTGLSLCGIAVALAYEASSRADEARARAEDAATRMSQQAEASRNRTVELFIRFQDVLRPSRDAAWDARIKWMNEPPYRAKFINALYADEPKADPPNPRLRQEINATYELLEFFAMLSVYNAEASPALRQFNGYFAWWRGYLLDVASQIEKRHGEIAREEACAQMPADAFTVHLESLGEKLGLPAYKQSKHPLDRRYPSLTTEHLR